MSELSNKTAVIIGRFQVPELHYGHKEFLDYVLDRHQRMIIFLGVPMVHGTRRDPLDFQSRKLMVEEYIGNRMDRVTILPLKDKGSDELWSEQIDEKIREVDPNSQIIMYGGRDSFVPHYKGRFETSELVFKSHEVISGTSVREGVSKKTSSSYEYRVGVISTIYNRYKTSYQTVDIACFDTDHRLLLGKKRQADKLCFIGGFVDVDDLSLEAAAKREFREETGGSLEIDKPKYVGSYRINDERYSKVDDKIMTALFTTTRLFGAARPTDDIYELHWVDSSKLLDEDWVKNNIEEKHHVLVEALISNEVITYT